MKIYVNWDEKKVLSETGMDRRIAEIFDDLIGDSDMMYDFLHNTDFDYQLLADIANGSDEELDRFRNSYEEYVKREAAEYFFEDYEEVEIEG